MMKGLTERQLNIMRQLISHNSYVSLRCMSEKIQISTRTLRRDIADINDKLSAQGITLCGKSGRGITIKFADAQSEISAVVFSLRKATSLSVISAC